MKKIYLLLAFIVLLAFPLAAQTSLFSFGSTWKYLDNGSNQGTAWRALSFDDGSWKTGAGKFGYGYGDETTVLSFGPDATRKYTTTYFRKNLVLADASAFSAYTGSVKRDDGVVVYVNGVEVYRNNLPTGTISYTTLASSASDNGETAINFNINAAAFQTGTNVIAVEVHQTSLKSFDKVFDLALSATGTGPGPGDTTPPAVSSINRQSPASQTTNATSLTFRATFSEAVTGVDAADFLVVLTSSATGTIGTVTPVSGSTYDVTVTGVGGNGTVGLNLKGSGTGIADAAGNPIAGGFTGQTYTIQQASTELGFASVINLNPVDARVDATKEKQQAKVFVNRGRHWAIIPNSNGTFLWRLDGTTWTSILRLSTRNARADAVVKEDTTHIFLFAGPASELVSVEYVPATNTYQPWSRRRVKTDITLDEGVETGSITLDATGRMWLASDGLATINVRYSDRPYTSWSGPVNIASGVSGDDICAVFHLPALNRIGVLWSNQTTDRFGFRTHINGTSPTSWTADEVPASQSALNVGRGMADDHLNMKVASDGTLYCAVKTSYDEPGFPVIALLIRRPTGTWDDLYEVAQNGTRPIVLLNEAHNKLKVVYTSEINGGDIQYKGSLMSAINFSPQLTLISGINNNVTSTHQNYTSEIVILASNSTQAVGVLASDVAPGRPEPGDSLAGAEQQVLRAFPNPFTTAARLRFQVPVAGPFFLAVYDGKGLVFQKQGQAQAGAEQEVELAAAGLARGLYFVRLQTAEGVKTLKLILDK